jgi:putative membrane protein
MVRLWATTALVAGLLASAAAFTQVSHPDAPGGTAPATISKESLSQQDKDFIKDAAEGDMAEVELSNIAEKSQNPEVKRFAERMVRDHTAANTELTRIVTALGIEMPHRVDTEHQRIRDQLAGMHDGAFDQQYMHVMVNDHDQAVKLFREEDTAGGNPELKQFAQKTLPTIEQHQKLAIDLSHRLAETAAR